MTDSDAARRDILRAVRENLAQSAPPDPRWALESSPPGPLSVPERGDLVTRFTERLAAVGAQCTVVRGAADAADALARILRSAGVRRVVGSDAPLVQRLLPRSGDSVVLESLDRLTRDELFACEAGVTTAQWGIAETGTLVL